MKLVMVVDDDQDVRDFSYTMIRKSGFLCVVCDSAERVFRLLDEVFIHLALVDINLRGKNGVNLCWQMRQRLKRTPIVIMSAMLEESSLDGIRDCGADSILAKPIEVHELHDILGKYLGYSLKEP